MTNKFIIHNYTQKSDLDVMTVIFKVIEMGKISQTKKGDQYCFVTTFKSGIVVTCDLRNNTYTFKVYEEDNK